MATGRQLHFQHHQIQAEERDGQRTKGVCQFIPSHFTFFSVFYRVYLEAPPHNICLHHIGCNCPQPSLASPTLASPILAESNPKERWCSAATSIVSPANPLCQHWWGTMNSLRLKKKPCSYHRNISISVQCGYVTEKLLLIIWRKYWTSSEWLIGPHEEQGTKDRPTVKIHPLISQSMPQGSGSSQRGQAQLFQAHCTNPLRATRISFSFLLERRLLPFEKETKRNLCFQGNKMLLNQFHVYLEGWR